MSNLGKLTYPEISEQAEALAAAWNELNDQQDWIRAYLNNDAFDEVIFIGSGSSYYQAQTMASTYRRWLGKSATAHPSSEILLFREHATVPNKNYLLVGVSRSGESSEVVMALESVASLANWKTCGITCHETSTMGKMAPCLISPLGQEKSTVMTKSFSSMTYMMQAAIAQASGNAEWITQMEQIINLDRDVVKKVDQQIKQLVQEHDFNKYIYLGMSTYFGLAQEACLKIKEMAYVWTESFGTLEFRHGPKSIVEPGSLVCLFVSEQAREQQLKVAQEMKEYGAFVLLLTAQSGEDTEFADVVVELGAADFSDEARSVLYLPAIQYLGFYTALKLDVDPDSPRNLTQVVII